MGQGFRTLLGLAVVFATGGYWLNGAPAYAESPNVDVPVVFLPVISSAQFLTKQDDSASEVEQAAWRTTYWNNRSLSGPPVLEQQEAAIDYHWPSGIRPHPTINKSGFSIRWVRAVIFNAGNYRFVATADDGMRVYIDGQLLIDQWHIQSTRTFTADINLSAGAHEIWVEYFENDGPGTARLSWGLAAEVAVDAWRGEYFNNDALIGEPALVRNDADIDFDWGTASPAPGIVVEDDFSVRWTRELHFDKGRYEFVTKTNDGVRLYVDGDLIINEWRSMKTTEYKEKVKLSAGNHTIRMEYFDDGTAVARLRWEKVDDGDGDDGDDDGDNDTDVGNIITCVPPNPPEYAWIRVYRWEGDADDGSWQRVLQRGIGSINPSGFLKIDGLPVNVGRYGTDGHPYWVEQWIDNQVTQSVGNTGRGEAGFYVHPMTDNFTPWQCNQVAQ